MNSLEQLARLLPGTTAAAALTQYVVDNEVGHDEDGNPIQITVSGTHSGRPTHSAVAEIAGALAGLNQAQEQLIWCKYLGDGQSCAKGLRAYRAQLYRDKRLRDWIFMAELPAIEKLEDKMQLIIDHRTSASAILSSCAYTDITGSFQCGVCHGAGFFEAPQGEITCAACGGKGHEGRKTTAQMRADKLHMSLRSYHTKFHKPYIDYYWKPLIEIETAAIMHITNQLK